MLSCWVVGCWVAGLLVVGLLVVGLLSCWRASLSGYSQAAGETPAGIGAGRWLFQFRFGNKIPERPEHLPVDRLLSCRRASLSGNSQPCGNDGVRCRRLPLHELIPGGVQLDVVRHNDAARPQARPSPLKLEVHIGVGVVAVVDEDIGRLPRCGLQGAARLAFQERPALSKGVGDGPAWLHARRNEAPPPVRPARDDRAGQVPPRRARSWTPG